MSVKYLLRETYTDGKHTDMQFFSRSVWDHYYMLKADVDEGRLYSLTLYKWSTEYEGWKLIDEYPNEKGI